MEKDVIAKYGYIAPKERYEKFGGVCETKVDGQLHAKGIESYLDAFLESKIFSQEQYNSVSMIIRDYQIGCLYKWKIVRDYLKSAGLSEEDANREREECRKNFYAAIKYNGEFIKLANIAHVLLEHADYYEIPEQKDCYFPGKTKLQHLADRLTKFYCTNKRIEME